MEILIVFLKANFYSIYVLMAFAAPSPQSFLLMMKLLNINRTIAIEQSLHQVFFYEWIKQILPW